MISRSGGQVRVLESDIACGDWRGDLTSALDALDAKALVVVTTSDTYDRRIDGTDVVVGSAQWNEMYTEHLTWLSRTAAGAGSRLVLVTPVPRSSRFYVEADNESGWREQAVVDAMRNFAAGNPARWCSTCGRCCAPPVTATNWLRASTRHGATTDCISTPSGPDGSPTGSPRVW